MIKILFLVNETHCSAILKKIVHAEQTFHLLGCAVFKNPRLHKRPITTLIIGTETMQCHIHSDNHITPVIRVKRSPVGGAAIMMRDFISEFHHTLERWVWLDFSISYIWHPLGNWSVRHAETMALTINTADVPYFRWTNNSQLTVLVSALYLSD